MADTGSEDVEARGKEPPKSVEETFTPGALPEGTPGKPGKITKKKITVTTTVEIKETDP